MPSSVNPAGGSAVPRGVGISHPSSRSALSNGTVSKNFDTVVKQPFPAPAACSAALGTWIYIENTMSCSCCFIRKNLESVKYNSLG